MNAAPDSSTIYVLIAGWEYERHSYIRGFRTKEEAEARRAELKSEEHPYDWFEIHETVGFD